MSVYSVTIFLNCCFTRNHFGQCLEHLSLIMHGEFGLIDPHGPCILVHKIGSYAKWSVSLSGIFAEIIPCTSSKGVTLLADDSVSKICECGKSPLLKFNDMSVCIVQICKLRLVLLFKKNHQTYLCLSDMIEVDSVLFRICGTMFEQFSSCPGILANSFQISIQLELQVNITSK